MRVLRTACFHEYVRETEFLLLKVEEIDSLMAQAGLSYLDCMHLLAGNFERLIASVHLRDRLQILRTKLIDFSQRVHPLAPHVLLGRSLRTVPFYSLGQHFRTDLNWLPKPSQTLYDLECLQFGHAIPVGGSASPPTHRCWVTNVRASNEQLSTSETGGALSPYPYAPAFLFANTSLACDEATIKVILLHPSMLSLDPLVVASLWASPEERLPVEVQRALCRCEVLMRRGNTSFAVTKAFDPYPWHQNVPVIAVVPSMDCTWTSVASAVNGLVHKSSEPSIPPSALADTFAMYKNKSNREFYTTALKAVSVMRMGRHLDMNAFESVVDVVKKNQNLGAKKLQIPHTHLSSINEARAKYPKICAQIFPSLRPAEREASSEKLAWLLKP